MLVQKSGGMHERRNSQCVNWILEQKLKEPYQVVDLDDNAGRESDPAVDSDVPTKDTQYVEEHGNLSLRNCAVCLEEFMPSDLICTSNNPECDHVYHRHCIFNWLLKNEDCPCCRRDYLAYD
jgi:hypothetical protein